MMTTGLAVVIGRSIRAVSRNIQSLSRAIELVVGWLGPLKLTVMTIMQRTMQTLRVTKGRQVGACRILGSLPVLQGGACEGHVRILGPGLMWGLREHRHSFALGGRGGR